ncbi:hypothetical protein ONZ45_g8318 [Pleurotus djamor]|nr:hypothetical protein ONZ45_g8318 [Pleurotus djamor]
MSPFSSKAVDLNMALSFKDALTHLENSRVKSTRPLIPPQILQEDLPLTLQAAQTVLHGRLATQNILHGDDDRLVVVVGPCSVHNVEAAVEYAKLLAQYAEDAKDDLLIIMRVYFEKPRTTVGWKGLINDPELNGSFQINKGLRIARSLLLEVAKIGLPAGCEFLDTITPQYTADLVSWGAIGARTTESQVHRELVSALSMPTGFKNSTDGSVGIAIDACRAARSGHVFLSVGKEGLSSIVETSGNPDVHVILRGGSSGPNYKAEFVRDAGAKLAKAGMAQKIMIDCSHGNSSKQHQKQVEVADDIARQLESEDTSQMIMGVMIESNLSEGRQDIPASGPAGLKWGQSVTDACISWETTVPVLERLREGVTKSASAFWQGSRPLHVLAVLVVSLVLAVFEALTLPTGRSLQDSIYSSTPLVTICLPVVLYACLARATTVSHFRAILLQSIGLIFAFVSLFGDQTVSLSRSSTFTFSASTLFALLDHFYESDPDATFFKSTSPLLGSSIVVFLLAGFARGAHKVVRDSLANATLPPIYVPVWFLLEAITSVLGFAVIFHHGAILLGVSLALGVAVVSTWNAFDGGLLSSGFFVGIALTLLGAWMFVASSNSTEATDIPETPPKSSKSGSLLLIVLALAGALSALVVLSNQVDTLTIPQLESPAINPSAPHRQLLSPSNSKSSSSSAQCTRKPLRSHLFHTPESRKYHKFDDILLIVFFSHARYGANLDLYKEVYSEYFPNIVFIGPASREDAGFAHSYDLIVDSYQSDEDLKDPNFYKMAGRMAHHMLYTAMMEHTCYEGYLWAPFDTLLNIPRLELFDQTKFWYYSPWGRYVPNPALGLNGTGGGESTVEGEAVSATGGGKNVGEAARHPPPARISPDPYGNYSETWRGWQVDWWWGDPHVGLSVCLPAFEKVPPSMRSRLAAFSAANETRFIGGSADTVYIPGRHRDAFMDVLSLFLETNCFLEIAVPTTVHLVVPLEEQIEFVDHWWIWEAPFNATFVRQKWKEGYEVDTFHTFHWGEKDQISGVWKGNHDHVEDIRMLLRESALRQGIRLP